MKFNIRVTDNDWFRFLNQIPLDEVNFWMPSGKQGFDALQRGEPLLFKLAAPNNHIAGGGFFVTFRRLPVSLAWRAFGEKTASPAKRNFAPSLTNIGQNTASMNLIRSSGISS